MEGEAAAHTDGLTSEHARLLHGELDWQRATGLELMNEQRKQYDVVLKGFDTYLISKKNVIYE